MVFRRDMESRPVCDGGLYVWRVRERLFLIVSGTRCVRFLGIKGYTVMREVGI